MYQFEEILNFDVSHVEICERRRGRRGERKKICEEEVLGVFGEMENVRREDRDNHIHFERVKFTQKRNWKNESENESENII